MPAVSIPGPIALPKGTYGDFSAKTGGGTTESISGTSAGTSSDSAALTATASLSGTSAGSATDTAAATATTTYPLTVAGIGLHAALDGAPESRRPWSADVQGSFAGDLHSSRTPQRGDRRVWPVQVARTAWATVSSLVDELRTPGAKACSGDLLGGAVTCLVVLEGVQPNASWQAASVTLTLYEVG